MKGLSMAVIFVIMTLLHSCSIKVESKGFTGKVTCYSGGKVIYSENFRSDKDVLGVSFGSDYLEIKTLNRSTKIKADCIEEVVTNV